MAILDGVLGTPIPTEILARDARGLRWHARKLSKKARVARELADLYEREILTRQRERVTG